MTHYTLRVDPSKRGLYEEYRAIAGRLGLLNRQGNPRLTLLSAYAGLPKAALTQTLTTSYRPRDEILEQLAQATSWPLERLQAALRSTATDTAPPAQPSIAPQEHALLQVYRGLSATQQHVLLEIAHVLRHSSLSVTSVEPIAPHDAQPEN